MISYLEDYLGKQDTFNHLTTISDGERWLEGLGRLDPVGLIGAGLALCLPPFSFFWFFSFFSLSLIPFFSFFSFSSFSFSKTLSKVVTHESNSNTLFSHIFFSFFAIFFFLCLCVSLSSLFFVFSFFFCFCIYLFLFFFSFSFFLFVLLFLFFFLCFSFFSISQKI